MLYIIQCCITTMSAVYKLGKTFFPDTLMPNNFIRRSKFPLLTPIILLTSLTLKPCNRTFQQLKNSIAPREYYTN
jgi:hypothetical protein